MQRTPPSCQHRGTTAQAFEPADELTCPLSRIAVLDGDAAACSLHDRRLPRLHLHVGACAEDDHGRGAAALTQILVTWQRGQDEFVARGRKVVQWERDIARLMWPSCVDCDGRRDRAWTARATFCEIEEPSRERLTCIERAPRGQNRLAEIRTFAQLKSRSISTLERQKALRSPCLPGQVSR